jgi:hypothetical protein
MSFPPESPFARAAAVPHFARVNLAKRTAFCFRVGLEGGDRIAGSERAHLRPPVGSRGEKDMNGDSRMWRVAICAEVLKRFVGLVQMAYACAASRRGTTTILWLAQRRRNCTDEGLGGRGEGMGGGGQAQRVHVMTFQIGIELPIKCE